MEFKVEYGARIRFVKRIGKAVQEILQTGIAIRFVQRDDLLIRIAMTHAADHFANSGRMVRVIVYKNVFADVLQSQNGGRCP